MANSNPRVSNVKGHFRLPRVVLKAFKKKLSYKRTKQFGNFVSLKERYTYIIFPQSGFINVTGIKTLEEVPQVVQHFFQDFELDSDCVKLITFDIDSMTATADAGIRIDLVKLQKYVSAHRDSGFTITYNRNRFSGASCRSKLGTAVVFASGRYNLLGCKARWQIRRVSKQLSVIIRNALTTTEMENQCVLDADSSWNSFMIPARATNRRG